MAGHYICNYVIAWVSGQYGEILHECAQVFSRAEGEGKYCTRVQCLAILTANPCNEGFIIHFFDHWSLTTINQTQESSLHEKTYLLVYSVRKHCSHGLENRLGWRASGNRSGITSNLLSWTLLTAELAIVYCRFQKSYLSKTNCAVLYEEQ